jgi:hypothetical protein
MPLKIKLPLLLRWCGWGTDTRNHHSIERLQEVAESSTPSHSADAPQFLLELDHRLLAYIDQTSSGAIEIGDE